MIQHHKANIGVLVQKFEFSGGKMHRFVGELVADPSMFDLHFDGEKHGFVAAEHPDYVHTILVGVYVPVEPQGFQPIQHELFRWVVGVVHGLVERFFHEKTRTTSLSISSSPLARK